MVKPAADWTERSLDLSNCSGRAGLGDRAAFATLYERTSSHLYAVVLRINRDRAQAETSSRRSTSTSGAPRAASMRPRASPSPG
jgi:hypothetical protein